MPINIYKRGFQSQMAAVRADREKLGFNETSLRV